MTIEAGLYGPVAPQAVALCHTGSVKPDVILFDLDETLTDRRRSFPRYVEHVQRDFGGRLRAATAEDLVAAIIAADGDGYKARSRGHGGDAARPAGDRDPAGRRDERRRR
jgi:hypothetical protein